MALQIRKVKYCSVCLVPFRYFAKKLLGYTVRTNYICSHCNRIIFKKNIRKTDEAKGYRM